MVGSDIHVMLANPFHAMVNKYLTLSATRRQADARPDPPLGGRRSSAGLSLEPSDGSRSRPKTLGGGHGVSAVGGATEGGRYDVTRRGAWRVAGGRTSCPEASPCLRHTNRFCAMLHGRFGWDTMYQWTTRSRLDLPGHAVLIPRK